MEWNMLVLLSEMLVILDVFLCSEQNEILARMQREKKRKGPIDLFRRKSKCHDMLQTDQPVSALNYAERIDKSWYNIRGSGRHCKGSEMLHDRLCETVGLGVADATSF